MKKPSLSLSKRAARALLAAAVDEHQAGLRVLDLLDAGDGADLVKRLVRKAVGRGRVGAPHLAAFAQALPPDAMRSRSSSRAFAARHENRLFIASKGRYHENFKNSHEVRNEK